MALYPLQPGLQPLGQFDFLDTDLAAVLGGELATWSEAARTNSTTEKAAFDALDGYVADGIDTGVATATRAILQLADGSTGDDSKAFYLTDDGIAGYGATFGTLIGSPVGLSTSVSGGVVIGPGTYRGSGKVTVWGESGTYAVSLDAVHSAATPNAGLAAGLDTPLPGDYLCRHSTNAKICRQAVAVNPTLNKVAVFIEMSGNGSLVNTPSKLIGAAETFDRIKIHFLGAQKNV